MNFWNNYQYLCKKAGLSTYEVARKCGVKSSASVTYWRQGSVPKPTVLNKIASVLDVSASELVSNDLEALDTLATSEYSGDPVYSAVMKLTPKKRALALAYIAGLTAVSDDAL